MPDVEGRVGKRTSTIQRNANNPILAAKEIRVLRKEKRELRSQLARAAQLNEIGRFGTVLPDSVADD